GPPAPRRRALGMGNVLRAQQRQRQRRRQHRQRPERQAPAPAAAEQRQYQRQGEGHRQGLAHQEPVGIDRGGEGNAVGRPFAHQGRHRRLHHRDARAHGDGGGVKRQRVSGQSPRRSARGGEQ